MDGVSSVELGTNLESEVIMTSLSGQDLSSDWPQIITNKIEEVAAYTALYDPGENPDKAPTHPHAERLSYELDYGSKRLRFFAVDHHPEPNQVNFAQYDIIEKRFKDSPPEIVLIEGKDIDFNYSIENRDEAIKHGEQYFMSYLVQQHNIHLKEGEKPIAIEGGDEPVNNESDNQIRDQYIVKNGAEKFKKYNKVDMVFGSGHAIRQKQAWEQYFAMK